MEQTSEVNKVTKCDGDQFLLHNPCNYFQEFKRAILNCLGLNPEPQNSNSDVNGGNGTSSQGAADPPSSAADPPAAPQAATARSRIRRPTAPPPPPINPGPGPQTNANPS